jgi:hypothetical protein
LNYLKDEAGAFSRSFISFDFPLTFFPCSRQDPVAKEDSEYPEWLWTIAEKEGSKQKGDAEAERLRAERKQIKRERTVAIKAANTLKG